MYAYIYVIIGQAERRIVTENARKKCEEHDEESELEMWREHERADA
jgi:hypothetical protein